MPKALSRSCYNNVPLLLLTIWNSESLFPNCIVFLEGFQTTRNLHQYNWVYCIIKLELEIQFDFRSTSSIPYHCIFSMGTFTKWPIHLWWMVGYSKTELYWLLCKLMLHSLSTDFCFEKISIIKNTAGYYWQWVK